MSSIETQDIPQISTSLDGAPTLDALAIRVKGMSTAMTQDQVMSLRETLSYMASQIKELRSSLDEKLMEWIEANGAITIGTRKIFIGDKKDTEVRDLKKAVGALLDKCDGDFDQFCECLSANALKYGACKVIMGEDLWGKHFQVVRKMELKDGVEKPVKQIVDADQQFIKPKRSKAQ